jgi:hypothetical protein
MIVNIVSWEAWDVIPQFWYITTVERKNNTMKNASLSDAQIITGIYLSRGISRQVV